MKYVSFLLRIVIYSGNYQHEDQEISCLPASWFKENYGAEMDIEVYAECNPSISGNQIAKKLWSLGDADPSQLNLATDLDPHN